MPYKSPYPDLEIPKCNVLSFVFPEGEKPSNKPLWIDAANPDHSLSPAQMLSWVKRFAVGLDNLQIPKEKAIMVFTPNHLYVPIVYLASGGSGRIFTGANPTYTVNEVAHQMGAIEAALLFVHPDLLQTAVKAAKQANFPLSHVYQFSETEQPTTSDGIKDWRSMLASPAASKAWQWEPLSGDASVKTVCCVNFSSGTTGLPKGVMISHHNLIANSTQSIYNKYSGTPYSINKPDPNERWLAMLPLYHAYSQLWTINIATKLNVTCYLMGKFVFEDYLRYIEKYKITHMQTVPPVIVQISKRTELTKKYDLTSVKHIMCGAAPLKSEMQNDVKRKLGCVIAQGWGMTETTCVGMIVPGMVYDDTGSIGYLIPNTEAKLIDEEGKEVTGDGARGELLLRGPQIMIGYWRNAQATKDSIDAQGWFRSGDVALLEDGKQGQKWWIVDRMKELIKVKGLQVAPAELEGVLTEHPDIADAAVCGISVDDDEAPRGYVVLQSGAKVSEEDIQKFVADKVARHKRLTGGVKFVDEVPKNPSGKIMRKIMREWAKRDAAEVSDKLKARI
ncbi:putative acyl-coenzyme A synthetase [Cyphellophora attinorum]|uniref:Putative acyl-coenzyme A synthetase n=1 Tax=Cyphellophora attinorum TaxID=1664694 RepID=A0A0N0NKX2_9EURO|nr:putative acyl-coenzyme A synthetase [Phialophora attinorum]KPI38339.1 putative acyl-coenzyme A synthetase [Phialophora attinorum]